MVGLARAWAALARTRTKPGHLQVFTPAASSRPLPRESCKPIVSSQVSLQASKPPTPTSAAPPHHQYERRAALRQRRSATRDWAAGARAHTRRGVRLREWGAVRGRRCLTGPRERSPRLGWFQVGRASRARRHVFFASGRGQLRLRRIFCSALFSPSRDGRYYHYPFRFRFPIGYLSLVCEVDRIQWH